MKNKYNPCYNKKKKTIKISDMSCVCARMCICVTRVLAYVHKKN